MAKQKILLTTLLVVTIVSLLATGAIYLSGSKTGVTKTETNTTDKTSNRSNQITEKPTVSIMGTFNLVYGDPQSGGSPRYYYSVTDEGGKTTVLKFTNETNFIDGANPSDYDRKKVKVAGKATQDINTVEVQTIELE